MIGPENIGKILGPDETEAADEIEAIIDDIPTAPSIDLVDEIDGLTIWNDSDSF